MDPAHDPRLGEEAIADIGLLAQLSASTLTATGTSRSSSLPSHTVANDPAPIRRTSRYRPMESITTIVAWAGHSPLRIT
jgi:hypothetical protein